MEERALSEQDQYLVDSDKNEENVASNKGCCCFFYCCCQEEKALSKSYYINKWRKYLSHENENISRPFLILTNLWAHKNVIKDLENIRLNPNLISEKNIRNDLEFYIPQLCTFLIFGDYEVVEEFLAFLCKACFASVFFAHRIIWFLKSLQLQNGTSMNEKIEYILQLIQTIFKSEKDRNKIERFHISNSRKYIEYIQKYNLMFLYKSSDVKEDSLNAIQREHWNMFQSSENLVKSYSDKLYNYAEEVEQLKLTNRSNEIKPFVWKFFLNTEEIFLNVFKHRNNEKNNLSDISKPERSDDIDISKQSQSLIHDVNLTSFLSGINFVDELCSISERMGDVPVDLQMSFLRKEITELNKSLPANVYVPFLKDSARNSIVGHIPITELKIFRTKNRAPFMITIEIIRMDEINKTLIKKDKSIQKSNVGNTLSKNNYVPPDDTTKKIRSYSVSNSESDKMINDDSQIRIKKGALKTKTFLGESNQLIDKRIRSSTLKMLAESDIRLSKPVIISNLEQEKKRTPLRGQNKIILEENEDKEESFVKEDIEQIIKRRLTTNPIRSENRFSIGATLKSGSKINVFNNEPIDEEINLYKSRGRNFTIGEMPKKDKVVESNSNILDNIDKDETKEIFFENPNIDKQYQDVFGELTEEQAERLRRSSPFGQLNTWQTFKIIIKSGEDLRQEQFATQLINEFHQIFQLEKVNCWVNPYEIIATGSNVGIIECVPNAISVDQLKRKIGVQSLRNFYENYFGPPSSIRFHKAMKNFIKSLAGYSLICYFLQIKDRHNGNILLDNHGHIIHIDFGFLLSNAPGKGLKFENVPFKLTSEFVETMGGVNSKYFTLFRKLLWKGFIACAKHSEKILILVEMMYLGHGKFLPCFELKGYTVEALKSRFMPRPKMNKVDYMRHVDLLIEQSIDNWRTRWYDKFQYYFQGIFY